MTDEAKESTPKKGTSPLKIIGIGVIVLILLVFLGAAYIYFGVIRPLQGLDIQPGQMRPVSLSPNVVIEGTFIITNPGGETRIPKIDLDLYVGETLIASGEVPETVLPPGSTESVNVNFVSDMNVFSLILLLESKKSQDVRVGGKIHSRPIAIPIPKLPVPVDLAELLGPIDALKGTPVFPMLSTLEKNPDLTVGEALESREFIEGMEASIGRDITDQEIAQLRDFFEAQGMLDMKADEVINNPAFLEMYQMVTAQ
ncbi:MAG: hypothetical protein GXO65_00885 [Euryarchaeota archaeon]|nr:hypothetical protein [Euryarchaeota archaeon]